MKATLRARCRSGLWAIAAAFCLRWAISLAGASAADIVTLKNGMMLEGELSHESSLKVDALNPTFETALQPILVIDNRLTRTFVAQKQLAKELTKPPAITLERITLPQRTPAAGNVIQVVGRPLKAPEPFDDWGRRTYVMAGQRGRPLEIVQGITEITPRWTKLEAIEGINHLIWTMKIATTSIPREQLSNILGKALDSNDPEHRLRIVRLYMQSDRFQDARLELEQLIKDFPNLAHLNDTVKELRQRNAQQIIKEIELRRDAGQYRFAVAMLEAFPPEGVAGETVLKVRELLDEIQSQVKQGEKVLKLLDANFAALRADQARADTKQVVAEMKSELNINTLDRFGPFLRLADDPKMSAEQKLGLAISGWLMGSAGAIDNLETCIGLVKLRDLARKYFLTARPAERDAIRGQLPSEANPAHLAAIIANMKPPLPMEVAEAAPPDVGNPAAVLGVAAPAAPIPPQQPQSPVTLEPAAKVNEVKGDEKGQEDGSECAPPKDDSKSLLKGTAKPVGPPPKAAAEPAPEQKTPEKPAAPEPPRGGVAQATGIPGLFELTVNTKLSEEPLVKYWVQLPPEYDPYRRYPCVVTLNGAGTTPRKQIDWWAGDYSPQSTARYGQATRHGYIVIAPQWTREHQREYEFSAREHAAVLQTLRDACKRFSIDVDRVFLTGHSMGGTAAWDIGLSHPDLWAGVLPIVATAGKYIRLYEENGKYVPMYFVAGEKDTATYANQVDWDAYIKKIGYDVMIVHYLGRGHEDFSDDIQNLFAWMNLHKRDFLRKQFEIESLRPWDNFFWCAETGDPREINMILPAEWGENPFSAKKPQPEKIEVKPIAPNGVRVTARGCGSATVWLSPDLVAFNSTLKVIINGDNKRNVQPQMETILEDVRTRGDRQHPFWAKASWHD